MLRLAQLIHDHWVEGVGMDTRNFELPLIHDSLVEFGQSTKGGRYREHAVPRVVLRDACLRMFDQGATVDEVHSTLLANLWIVYITPDEARFLDHDLKLKSRMPDHWEFGVDDPFARFHHAQISIVKKSDGKILTVTGAKTVSQAGA